VNQDLSLGVMDDTPGIARVGDAECDFDTVVFRAKAVGEGVEASALAT
jgi:hypothetical protein